jgi:hypothetical protein
MISTAAGGIYLVDWQASSSSSSNADDDVILVIIQIYSPVAKEKIQSQTIMKKKEI